MNFLTEIVKNQINENMPKQCSSSSSIIIMREKVGINLTVKEHNELVSLIESQYALSPALKRILKKLYKEAENK